MMAEPIYSMFQCSRSNQLDSANTSEDDDDIHIGPYPQIQQP